MLADEYKIPKISISQWDAQDCLTIDVRSPQEFEEASLPTAINVPIFDNEERVKVGTIYKQVGKEEAVKLGLSIYSKKIPDIFETIIKLKEKHPKEKVVIVCARGGMRSHSIASTLNMLGIHSYQLEGGFRAYRSLIVDKLNDYATKEKRYFIVSGNTGSKKTIILQKLKHDGYPVLDLEDLAGHRGSAFGGIGLKVRSQKMFEALLVEELEFYQDSPYFIIESESKRIGNIIVPDFIINGKKSGINIELVHPLQNRVQHIVETYQPSKYGKEILEAFMVIKKRMPVPIGTQIHNLLLTKQYELAFELLLKNYYDPQYVHASLQNDQLHHQIKFTQMTEAVQGVKNMIDHYEYKLNKIEGMV